MVPVGLLIIYMLKLTFFLAAVPFFSLQLFPWILPHLPHKGYKSEFLHLLTLLQLLV